MRNLLVLLFVALLAIAVLLFLFNPALLEEIWLWIIGLIGVIVSAFRRFFEWVKGLFTSEGSENKSTSNKTPSKEKRPSRQHDSTEQSDEAAKANEEIARLQAKIKVLEAGPTEEAQQPAQDPKDDFEGTTLTVIRYFDDGETTLGLLYVNNEFFSYTLEDTYRKVKIAGKTRIPAGTYELGFMEADTPLTLKYRKTRSPWFTYHLHVKKVPNYTGIYIHSGSTHEHTDGCLLVASNIQASDSKKMIYNSRKTFEILYKMLAPKLREGQKMRIKYLDEHFLAQSTLKNSRK